MCSVALELFLLAWCCQAAWKYRGMCRELRHRLATAVKKCFCCGPVIKDKRVLEGRASPKCRLNAWRHSGVPTDGRRSRLASALDGTEC